jgi:PAS domain S-box-containing protein
MSVGHRSSSQQVGSMSSAFDLPEKTYTQRLSHTEEHYRAIFENANDAIAFIALDGTIASINRSAEYLTGLSRRQIIGRPFSQFLTPASATFAEERIQRALAGEPLPSTFEVELLRSNGRTVTVEARTRFLRDQHGAIVGILGIYRDITERKQAEDALRQAHAELEQRVQERTADLAQANEALRAEIAERKRAEEAARAAEREYRALFENAVEGIYRSSLDGHQLRANPALVKLNGYESESEMLPAVNDIAAEWYVDPHRRAEFQRILAERGTVTEFESEVYRHKTRERIWISETARLVRDHHGTPLYYEGTVQDITARKRVEERLRASEEQYRLLFDQNPQPMWVCDNKTLAFLAVNDAAVQHYGYTRDEFLAMTIRDIRPAAQVQAIEGRLKQIQSRGRTTGVWQHQKKDGTLMDVEVTSHDIPFSGRSARVALAHDITIRKRAEETLQRSRIELEHRVQERTVALTQANHALQAEIEERKRIETALRDSEERYRDLFENANDVIGTSTLDGVITSVNRRIEQVLGYPREEIIGKCVFDLATPKSLKIMKERARLRNAGAEIPGNVELDFVRRDNTVVTVEERVRTILDPDGKPVGVHAIYRDITERKKVDQMKDELISTVSHELRTPLASLRGFAELMLQRNFSPEKQRDLLGVIHSEAIRLTHLIDDFLDLQRIEGGYQPYTFVSLALDTLLRENVDLFSKTGGPHSLRLAIASWLPSVRGDADRLRQVLVNLLSNAIKFSPQGGEIEVGAQADAHRVMVWVKDRGVGIPPEALAKLFTKFFRVDNSDTRNIGGTGLGLALVREIVHAHQGDVWVESTLGQGSTFFFTLPIVGLDS